MTERTFRADSPSRQSSSRVEETPPIPAVPQNYIKQASKNKLSRRPSSAEPPQRVISPIQNIQGGRGVSLDRSGSIPKSEPPPLPLSSTSQKLDTDNERQQAGSRASVNFSRPMSPQFSSPSSPTLSNRSPKQLAPGTQNHDEVISTSDVQNIHHTLQNAATKPAKKKKKKTVSQVVEGSHLHAGHSSAKPTGTAIDNKDADGKTAKEVISQVAPTVITPKAKGVSPLQADLDSESENLERSASIPEPSPSNARSAGKLTKQPSIVREDREGEEREERKAQAQAQAVEAREPKVEPGEEAKDAEDEQVKQPNGTMTPFATFAEASPQHFNNQADKNVANGYNQTKPTLGLQTDVQSKEDRRLSWSPSRSTRFSAQPMLDVPGLIKHEPPARAASPAKSAMKRSPSPRAPTPSALAVSELSDTMSLGSEDGIKSGKKKNVRVSFDDEPLVVGESADPQSNTASPVLFSPQNKDPNKRNLFGFTRNSMDLSNDDDTMSPVPKLPSFGSIRGRKEQREVSDADGIPHVFEADEVARRNLQQMTSSSDHAIGAMIARDVAFHNANRPAQDPNEPLPPEVTTVEGSGYHSDTESSDDGANGNIPIKSTEFPKEPSPTSLEPPKGAVENLPTIAVQPATPGLESVNEDRDSWLGSMPGSFPAADSIIPEPQATQTIPETLGQTEPVTLAKVGISEPEPEPVAQEQNPETPIVGQVSESIARQTIDSEDESDDTGDSIYSDAAEDVGDLEGDGFGSIDAIVDSPPVASSISSLSKATGPALVSGSPTTEASSEPHDATWEKTRTFWSEARQSTEPKSTEAQRDITPRQTSSDSIKTEKSLESNLEKQTERKSDHSISPPPKSKLRTIPKAPTMRKSMRAPRPSSQNESAVPLRYPVIGGSQNANEPPLLAKTLRQAPSVPVLRQPPEAQGQGRPPKKRLSTQKTSAETRQPSSAVANENKKAVKKDASVRQPQQPQALRKQSFPLRPLSNESDSDSSFKRARRRPANDSGRYTMRRSMRAGQTEGRPQSASFSSTSTAVAPQQPTMRERPMSASGMGLRTSLRDSSFRNDKISPPRSFGFGKGAKGGKKAQSKSRRLSSSSDEEGGANTFKSRFADSSDEDEPKFKVPLGLTPVRGIPKRGDDGDSTDLDDSDDQQNPRKPKQPSSSPPPLASPTLGPIHEGSALASGSLRTKHEGIAQDRLSSLALSRKAEPERRRSIFGALGRKKDKSKFKPDIESAARRDTPLERTRLERTAVGQTADSPVDIPPVPPMPPPSRGKLQRRITPQRVFSDSWPLPPPVPDSPTSPKIDRRPTTSDGSAPRPSVGQRKISTNTDVGEGAAVGRTGRRKRFPKLRKAFGLRD